MHEDDADDELGQDESRIQPPSPDESRVPDHESRGLHVPVLVRESLEYLNVRPDGIYIDATLGGGGHSQEILKRLESGRLLSLDRDPRALEVAGARLAGFGEKLMMQHGNFAQIDALHAASGLPPVDGVIADLGLSSIQLDDASRGFSFNQAGPIDMRMDTTSELTAADLVNHADERELADIFFKLGEERHSRRIARAIVKARPYRFTTELAQVVTRAIPSRAGLHQIHPATRTFMALRLAVNGELENLEQFLNKVLHCAPAGRPGGDPKFPFAGRSPGEASLPALAGRRPGSPTNTQGRSTDRRRSANQSASPQRQVASSRKTGNREQGIGDSARDYLFRVPSPEPRVPVLIMATAALTLPKTRRRLKSAPTGGRATFPDFYFVKQIDNSRLVREVDVERRRELLSLFGLGVLVFSFVLLLRVAAFSVRSVRLPD